MCSAAERSVQLSASWIGSGKASDSGDLISILLLLARLDYIAKLCGGRRRCSPARVHKRCS
jgi:hypothetical protein